MLGLGSANWLSPASEVEVAADQPTGAGGQRIVTFVPSTHHEATAEDPAVASGVSGAHRDPLGLRHTTSLETLVLDASNL
jgi:hypothetical protein